MQILKSKSFFLHTHNKIKYTNTLHIYTIHHITGIICKFNKTRKYFQRTQSTEHELLRIWLIMSGWCLQYACPILANEWHAQCYNSLLWLVVYVQEKELIGYNEDLNVRITDLEKKKEGRFLSILWRKKNAAVTFHSTTFYIRCFINNDTFSNLSNSFTPSPSELIDNL